MFYWESRWYGGLGPCKSTSGTFHFGVVGFLQLYLSLLESREVNSQNPQVLNNDLVIFLSLLSSLNCSYKEPSFLTELSILQYKFFLLSLSSFTFLMLRPLISFYCAVLTSVALICYKYRTYVAIRKITYTFHTKGKPLSFLVAFLSTFS